jgi:outer membrane protein assembly factor BamB
MSVVYIQKQRSSPSSVKSGVFLSSPIWDFETHSPITSSPVADNDGSVFVRTSDSIIAVDSHNGNELWSSKTASDTPRSIAPYIFEGYLVTPEKGSRIAVFRAKTGELIWRTPVIDVGSYGPSIESISFLNETLYVARFDWGLTAYDIHDGKIIWEQKYSTRYPPSVATNRQAIYLGLASEIRAYNPLNGTLLWKQNVNASIGQILLDHDILLVSDNRKSGMIGFDSTDQETLWRVDHKLLKDTIIHCIVVADDIAYLAAQRLMAIKTDDGQMIWATDQIGDLECPVILNNSIYVRNTDTMLYAFDLDSGYEIGRISVQANTPMLHEPDRSPTTADGILVVPITDFHVAAYSP